MVKIKRFKISTPGLNPWIILGELSKLGEEKKKLFKDSKISDRNFLNFCYTRQVTCNVISKDDILALYNISIFEIKKKTISSTDRSTRQGLELISEIVVNPRTLFLEFDKDNIFLYDFKTVLMALRNLKKDKVQQTLIARHYEKKDFSIKISGFSLFNGPAIVKFEDLSSICREMNRNIRLFEAINNKPLKLRLVYEFESTSLNRDDDLDLLTDRLDLHDPSQILNISLIFDENVISSQFFKCSFANCIYQTSSKANYRRHQKFCSTRSKEIVPVLKSYGTTMNPISEAVELGFLPQSFLDFRKNRISKRIANDLF